jgi:membrane protease YdiL (CAAX protease family)
MGVLFALLFEATDSLWPCILLHGLINSLAFVAAYFAL